GVRTHRRADARGPCRTPGERRVRGGRMSFGHPLLLLTLLVIPAAAALYGLAQRRRMQYAVRFTNLEVLSQVAGGRSWRRHVPPVLFALALASLSFAVARPHARTLVPVDRATVILVIDASLSMQATDVAPSRLSAAQNAVRSFLDRVPKRVRVGLVVFFGEAQLGAPPTTGTGRRGSLPPAEPTAEAPSARAASLPTRRP